MRTTIALAAALAALACTNRVEVTPTPSEAAPVAQVERAPRETREAADPEVALDCPEGASATRLAIPAVDTVMTWCVRSAEDGSRMQHGPWRKQRNGHLVEEGSYQDDERHGEWTFRWGDGALQSRGHYEVGRKSGSWSFWGPDGELIRRVDYGLPEAESEEGEAEAESAAEPELEEPETVTVSLRLENSHETDLLFALEPWAEEYAMPPGSTFEVEATGPDTGDLVVESSDQAITVWAWEGAAVQLWVDGVEVEP